MKKEYREATYYTVEIRHEASPFGFSFPTYVWVLEDSRDKAIAAAMQHPNFCPGKSVVSHITSNTILVPVDPQGVVIPPPPAPWWKFW